MSDKNNPVWEEQSPIPGTHLYRRWQGGREISPTYIGPGDNESEALQEAQEQGISSIDYYGSLYVRLGGQWYAWYCSAFENGGKNAETP